MKKLLAIILAVIMVLSLVACGGGGAEPTKKPTTYPKLMGKLAEYPTCVANELYVWNERAEGKVYAIEYIPNGFDTEGGEKLPMVIFVHGNKGDANSLASEPKELAKSGIAGITFECRGANEGSAVRSDKGSASTTSRATDLDAVFEYVKTLSWVDQDQIYIYGQSHGGNVVMMAAPYYQDKIAGMIIESSGMSDGKGFSSKAFGMRDNEFPDFAPAEGQDWKDYIKSYKGNIIMLHAEGDTTISLDVAKDTEVLYNEREEGTCVLFATPGGEHAFNSFSDEGKEICYQAMLDFILK